MPLSIYFNHGKTNKTCSREVLLTIFLAFKLINDLLNVTVNDLVCLTCDFLCNYSPYH